MKILIAINSLVQGGAQKFTVELAKELTNSGHKVTLLTFYPVDTDFFEVPKDVEIIRFIHPFHDKGRKINYRLKRFGNIQLKLKRIMWRIQDLRDLRKILKESEQDVTIAIERYVGVLLGLIHHQSTPLIISERVHPDYHRIPAPFDWLTKFVYKRSNVYIHAQSFNIALDIKSKHTKLIAVIPNIVRAPIIKNHNKLLVDKKTAVCLGRFDFQKGYDLLIKAWAKIPSDTRNAWNLHIYGDNDQSPYKNLISEYNLEKSIKLHKATKNVQETLLNSDLFIMTSRYEGFPNSLAEAMALGVPSLVTDSPSAVRELTSNGKLAKLVGIGIDEISESLQELMLDEEARRNYGNLGKKIIEFYQPEVIANMWIEFIQFASESVVVRKNVYCPNCGNKSDAIDMKTRTQIMLELKKVWGIDFKDSNKMLQEVVIRYKCNSCGLSHFNSSPGAKDFYEACHASSNYERKDDWDYKKIVQKIDSNELTTIANILDIGSGFSKFINQIEDLRVKIDVVEIESHVLESMRNFVRKGFKSIEEVVGIYDLIMVSHFIEHISDLDDFLLKIRKLIRNGGYLAITVPDAEFNEELDSVLDWPPHHTYRFSKETLRKILEKNGFKFVETLIKITDVPKSNFDFCSIFRFDADQEYI